MSMLGIMHGCAPHLAEVARVILVHVDPVVVLATGITVATRVLAVLAHTTMASGHVAALLPVLLQPCDSAREVHA
jgi:hypothetical protein